MKEWNYEGKVFLVTGASSGIGRSCVEQLLNSEANVVGIDAKGSDLKDPHYMHYEASVTDDVGIARVVSEIENKFGRIDGLVNAAGIWGNSKPFCTISASQRKISVSVTTTRTSSASIPRQPRTLNLCSPSDGASFGALPTEPTTT